MNKNIESALNAQVEKEAYSSQLYLAMASWAERSGFEGVSQWLYAQANEERIHSLKLIAYINERDGAAIIPEIKKPPFDFEGIMPMFIEVYKHEQFITQSINEIVAQCSPEKDFTTLNWIQWYVNEQIMEEKSAKAIIDKLKLSGEHNLYIFDRDILGMRAAEAPVN